MAEFYTPSGGPALPGQAQAGWYSRRIVFHLSDRRAGPYARAACTALAACLSLAPATAAPEAYAAAPEAYASGQDAAARCAADAETVQCLLDAVPAAALEEALFADPLLPARVLPRIAGALMAAPGDARLGEYVGEVARARTRRLTALGSWTEAQGEALLRLQLVDATDRFAGDPAFRARVLALLPRAFDRAAPDALRDQLLYSINSVPGVDFAASEAVEWGWGAIPRRSLARETPYRAGALDFPDDTTDLQHDDFLITWNNVVLETVEGARRAEGFASGLATGDRQAAAAFTRAGYTAARHSTFEGSKFEVLLGKF